MGEKGPSLWQVFPGAGCWAIPRPGPDAASAPREESWTQSGKQRGPQGRRGLLPCCSRLRYACGLVGAPWAGFQASVRGGPGQRAGRGSHSPFFHCPAVGSPSRQPSSSGVDDPCPPLPPAPPSWAPGLFAQSWPAPLGASPAGPFALSPQALHSLGLALLSALQALTPWRYALKQIGGQFGSSVLSYFLFLKTLLAFNALLLLPLLAFIVGVQAAFLPAPADSVPTFTGLELLTGGVRAGRGRGRGFGLVGTRPGHSFPQGPPASLSAVTPGVQPALLSPLVLISVGSGKPQDGLGPLSTSAFSLPLPSPFSCSAFLLALPSWVCCLCLVKPEGGQVWGAGRVPASAGPPPCRAASPTPSCTTATTVIPR